MNKYIARTKWYMRQLLPLKYHSEYGEVSTGKKVVTVWKMWLGKCYNVKSWYVKGSHVTAG